eukprot:2912375-Amphidinium_carterae.1
MGCWWKVMRATTPRHAELIATRQSMTVLAESPCLACVSPPVWLGATVVQLTNYYKGFKQKNEKGRLIG